MRSTIIPIIATIAVLACLLPVAGETNMNPTAKQWSPVDIDIKNVTYTGNPFDLIAAATFKHSGSDEQRVTQLFYVGDNTWKIRFTGTRPGVWTYSTSGSNSHLNGLNGTITVTPAGEDDYGFVVHEGYQWARQKGPDAVLERFVPQYVMYSEPPIYHNNPARIDADIQTFLVQHGFNGFHTLVFCRWFDIDQERSDRIHDMDPNPDFRTFEALELLINKTHAAGGLVHMWMWGDEDRRMTPIKWGINGTVDRRLQRYVAARLGPLPGWTMGCGFDLFEWINSEQLCSWHSYMQQHMGWMHYLGGRSHTNRLTQICETLDYASYEQHKPLYEEYVKTIEERPHKPSMSEDRNRVGSRPPRDYTELSTRRGLWDSAMAGGVSNIWGNLVGRTGFWSMPYQYPQWSRTYADFFQGRFLMGMIRDNSITNGVCLRTPDRSRYIFYREDAESISMDLSNMPTATSAVAVDAALPYNEISIGVLQPGQHTWTAPYASDWAIAVENHTDTQAPSVPTNVNAKAESQWAIKVTWDASTDDTGVKNYKVFRNGTRIGTVTVPTYLDIGLTPETTYSYTISAADYAGNESAQSPAAALATTLAMPDYCSADLGFQNVFNLLFHPQHLDGTTSAVVAGGRECRKPAGERDRYFYFAIDNRFIYNESGTTRYLEVSYFDDQPSSVYLEPQYDAVGDGDENIYTSAEPAHFTNTGEWKTARWTLTDCRFADRQHSRSDFRIYVGPHEVIIGSVRLSKVPFSD